MPKPKIVSATVALDSGVTLTATMNRGVPERPVTVEGSDGQRWEGEWDAAMAYVASEQEIPWGDAARPFIDNAIREASNAAYR